MNIPGGFMIEDVGIQLKSLAQRLDKIMEYL